MNRRTAADLDYSVGSLPVALTYFAVVLALLFSWKLPWLVPVATVAALSIDKLDRLTSKGPRLKRQEAFRRLRRRRRRRPVASNTLRLIGKLEAGGKWQASAGGVAIGLGVALMITAYGALIPDFDDCVARHGTSQSIQTGRQMMLWFIGSGFCGLVAAVLPSLVATIRLYWHPFRPDPSRLEDHDLHWMRQGAAGYIVLCQVFLTCFWLPLFAGGLALVVDLAAQQTPENLFKFRDDLQVACGAPPAP